MINPEIIDEIFRNGTACLLDSTQHIKTIEGITESHSFYMPYLQHEKSEIIAILQQLPLEFHFHGGGGWSFLNMCNDRDGNQWTGEHWMMEKLCLIAIALGYMSFLMPRSLWHVLPGEMPYVVITLPGEV